MLLRWICKKLLIVCPNCDGSLDYQNMGEIRSYADEKNIKRTKFTEYAVCHDCKKIYEVWKKKKDFSEVTQKEWEKIKKYQND